MPFKYSIKLVSYLLFRGGYLTVDGDTHGLTSDNLKSDVPANVTFLGMGPDVNNQGM